MTTYRSSEIRTHSVGITLGSAAAVIALSLAAAPFAEVSAQDREWATFAVLFGAYSPQTTFVDASFGKSRFESAAGISVSANAWPHENIGVGIDVTRSQTNGWNEMSDLAPLAAQDPTQWTFSAEVLGGYEFDAGNLSLKPVISAGAGMRHYTWHAAIRDEDKFLVLTASAGLEVRGAAFGPFGLIAEVRGYRSQFEAFGINGGNWRPGEVARPVRDDVGTDIGFYSGTVDDVWSHDLLFLLGISINR